MSDAMSGQDRLAIEAECCRLIAGFAFFVDRRRYTELVALFCDDGRFERPGGDATGHAQLTEFMEARPSDVATRHVCALPLFEVIAQDHAKSITYCTLYHAHGGDDQVIETAGPAALAEFHDEFRRTPDGWRFQHRIARPVMIHKY